MSERIYRGFLPRLDSQEQVNGIADVEFRLDDVIGMSLMDGGGVAPPMYFACLKNFRQVQVHKSVFNQLLNKGKRIACLA
jgi:hypothetical protein